MQRAREGCLVWLGMLYAAASRGWLLDLDRRHGRAEAACGAAESCSLLAIAAVVGSAADTTPCSAAVFAMHGCPLPGGGGGVRGGGGGVAVAPGTAAPDRWVCEG